VEVSVVGGNTTVLTPSTSRAGSCSLRVTVPIFIVKQFNLQAGDELVWDIRAEGNELVIVVRPKKRMGTVEGKK
jgi:antitoxin component of MazEF toxin-antitoxin module